jgi:hypothetical protein
LENFELFKLWVELEGINLDRLSWKETQRLIKDFENEEKQNSFSYKRALVKQASIVHSKCTIG